MAVILVRHTTPRVAPGTCYGQTDLPLVDSFEAEADQVLQSLPPIANIVSSPLQRCRRLAEHVAQARGLVIEIEPRLQEMDFGAWEGLPWNEIPRHELDAWAADFLHACPHGGETVARLQARVRQALKPWQAFERTTLCVTHAGVIRAALATGDTEEDFNTSIDFGGMIHLPPQQGPSR
ncbi:MAG: alpha-ribazole phosphatase [Pseudomonadota bacterium]